MKDDCENHKSFVNLFFEQVLCLYKGGLVYSGNRTMQHLHHGAWSNGEQPGNICLHCNCTKSMMGKDRGLQKNMPGEHAEPNQEAQGSLF